MADKEQNSQPFDDHQDQPQKAPAGHIDRLQFEVEPPDPEKDRQDQKVGKKKRTAGGRRVDQPQPVPAKEESPLSREELLAGVRRSIVEDETRQEKKQGKGWWKRISKSIQRSPRPKENILAGEPVEFPVSEDRVQAESEASIISVSDQSTSQYLKQFDDLLALDGSANEAEITEDMSVSSDEMVDAEKESMVGEASPNLAEEMAQKVEVQEPQAKSMPDAAVKAAFQAKAPETATADLSEVRAMALQDQREIFEEPPAESGKSISGRLDEMENTLRPYRRFIGFGLIVFGVVMGTVALLLFYNIFRPFFTPKPEPAPSLPYPSAISLPGGWAFNLGKGSVENGKWSPRGAEWLEGTEITRWVALPWSLQLEAVVRTLKPKDIIEVKMSNNDILKYKVYSIREMKVDEIQTLDNGESSLLLILAKEDSDTRWVVIAVP